MSFNLNCIYDRVIKEDLDREKEGGQQIGNTQATEAVINEGTTY